ncbi:MAG: methyltransferase domain-containing protein [Rhizobiales bacterium]|nr:methyltransferase domain-containing protein [Hyphomicrobiales bacterium]
MTNPQFDARQQLFINQIDLGGIGLEIGPGYSPIVPKSAGFRVETADHANAEQLREKYRGAPGVDIGRIEEVDHILDGRPLVEVFEPGRYDYVIASHVIEHLPDLAGFLESCHALLKPTGVLALAVPDKRACFDFYQPVSTAGQVIDAHLRKATRPSPGAVFDNAAYRASSEGRIAWPLGSRDPVQLDGDTTWAVHGLRQAVESDRYIDVHVWRFVPSSFRLMLADLAAAGFPAWREKAFLATSNFEFFCFLMPAFTVTGVDRLALLSASLREQLAVVR